MKSNPLLNILIAGIVLAGLYFYFKNKETNPESPDPIEVKQDGLTDPEPNQQDNHAFWESCNYCINSHTSRIVASEDRYLSWVNRGKGPQSNSADIFYGLYNTNDPKTCINKLKQPLLDEDYPAGMDEPAAHYLFDLQRIYNLTTRLERYYEQEDYKDDNLALGKQLHDTLMRSFADYFESEQVLRKASREAYEARIQSLLSYQDSSTEDYFLIRLVDAAYKLERLSLKPTRKTVDKAAYSSQLAQYQHALENYESYIKSHDNEELDSRSYFIDQQLDFLKAAKTLLREIDKPVTDTGSYSWGDYNDDPVLKELTSQFNNALINPKSADEGLTIPFPPQEERYFYRKAQ